MYYSQQQEDVFLHEKIPFPVKRKDGSFMGGRIDKNDNPINYHYKLVM